MAFATLLAKSQLSQSRLNDPTAGQPLNRTLAELSRVARPSSSSHPSGGADVADGVLLLASRNFDAAALGNDMMDMAEEMRSHHQHRSAFEPLGETDLYQYLNHHHEMIVSTVINDTQCKTLKHASDLMHTRQAEDWENEKMRLLHDLAGRRSGKWAPSSAPDTHRPSVSYAQLNNTSAMNNASLDYSNPNLLTNTPYPADPANAANNSLINNGGMFSPAPNNQSQSVSFASPLNAMTNLANTPGATPNAPSQFPATTLTESARLHVSLVSHVHRSNAKPPAVEFAILTESLAPKNALSSTSSAALAYPACYRLLATMLENRGSGGDVVEQRALGALTHLGNQYKEHITRKVRQAALAGTSHLASNNGESSGIVQDIGAFVELEIIGTHGGSIGTPMVPNAAPAAPAATAAFWPKVYFALRCFDYEAANAILRQAPADTEVDEATLGLSGLLSQTQAGGVRVNPGSLKNARRPVGELYHRIKFRESGEHPYKLAALNMLCLSDPQAAAGATVQTIEDYLFSMLWGALGGGTLEGGGAAAEVKKLGERLVYWGPQHFQKDANSDAWAYAYPLFVAQQWEKALAHLSMTPSGLMEAAHVAVVLSMEGVFEDGGAGRELCSNLLVSYSSSIQSHDPCAALEYLIVLPSDGEFVRVQVKRLLLQTRAYGVLAGVVGPDGSRVGLGGSSGGALDAHFREAEVNELLFECGEELVREGGGAGIGGAAELFALAGRYVDLLRLLNRELASRLVDGEVVEDEGRRFWRNAALNFHAAHLSSGRTHVLEVLEGEGERGVGDTFELILNLISFFDKCRGGLWDEAWTQLDMLGLLPRTEAELGSRVDFVHSKLDNSLKQHYHQVVLAGMESLFQQHQGVKEAIAQLQSVLASGRGGDEGVQRNAIMTMDGRLVELRNRARLIVTFAGLLQNRMSGDSNARIARLEAFMM